jgi:hypothetical protein
VVVREDEEFEFKMPGLSAEIDKAMWESEEAFIELTMAIFENKSIESPS